MGWTIYAMLIQFLFWIPLTILFLRLAFPLIRAPFSDPIVGWIYSVTNPALRPIEKVVPRWRNLSLAALLLFWLVSSLEYALLVRFGGPALFWLVGGLANAISFALGFLIVMILLYIIFSLVQPRAGSSIVFLTERVASPICAVFRSRVPMIGPFDLSPALAILVMMLLRLLLQWVVYELAPMLSS
jgi:YggT family protein